MDDVEDLDLVMRIHNLIEYSLNFSERTGSLWYYPKDEATDFNGDISNTGDFKSFKYKTELLGNTEGDETIGNLKNAIIAVPLKYFSNFWRSSEMPSNICKVELNFNGQSVAFCLQINLLESI